MQITRATTRTGLTLTRQPDGSFAREHPTARAVKSFDAASFSRLTSDWQVSRLSADAELQGKLQVLRSRSRDHEQNEPLQESHLLLRENNIVGEDGFTLQMKAILSETIDPETGALKTVLDHAANRAIERAWLLFLQSENFLVTRDMHATEACKLIERTETRDGDLLIRKVKGAPNIFGFALQLLEADYLDDQYIDFRGVPCHCPEERTLPNGRPFPRCERGLHEIRMGVELHGDWKFPVAYWLLANHPGDYFFGNQYATRRLRVPVEEIIHPFVHKRIEQTRGLPASVAAMLRLQMLGGMSEAKIVEARAAAQKMGVITKEVPEEFVTDEGGGGFDPNALAGRTLEGAPGEFLELPMGFDMKSIDWKTGDATYSPFVLTNQYDIAASLGVSCHGLTGNLAAVNFSTARIGDRQQKDTFRSGQGRFIRDVLLKIVPDFLEAAMLSGILDLPFSRFAAYTDPEAVCFHGRGWEYFDPAKDVEADLTAINGGLETRAACIARRTRRDFEQVTAELEREKQIRTEAGLTDPPPPDPAAAPADPPPEEAASTKSLKSAFLGDCPLSALPEASQLLISDFIPEATPDSRVLRYQMTVPELLDKADQKNLATAQRRVRTRTNASCAAEVQERQDKHILLLNDRIIDGHHHLAKAEKGKVTSSLPVLDLTPLRYQSAAPTKSFPLKKKALR